MFYFCFERKKGVHLILFLWPCIKIIILHLAYHLPAVDIIIKKLMNLYKQVNSQEKTTKLAAKTYIILVIVDVVLITYPFSDDISVFYMLKRLYEFNIINLSTFFMFY